MELAWGTLSSAQVRCQLFMQILSHFTILQSADVRVCSSRHLSASGHDRCPIPLPRPRKTRGAPPTFPRRRAKSLSLSQVQSFSPCKKKYTHKMNYTGKYITKKYTKIHRENSKQSRKQKSCPASRPRNRTRAIIDLGGIEMQTKR